MFKKKKTLIIYLLLLTVAAACSSVEPIEREYTLEISQDEEEGGEVEPEVGQHTYQAGTEVEFKAEPAAEWSFVGWEGSLAESEPKFKIIMDRDYFVKAIFSRAPEWLYELEIEKKEEGLELTGSLDREGYLYYLILEDGAAAPSKDEVKAEGQEIKVAAEEVFAESLEDVLASDRDYQLYLVSADQEGNLGQLLSKELLLAPPSWKGKVQAKRNEEKISLTGELDRAGRVFYYLSTTEVDNISAEEIKENKQGSLSSEIGIISAEIELPEPEEEYYLYISSENEYQNLSEQVIINKFLAAAQIETYNFNYIKSKEIDFGQVYRNEEIIVAVTPLDFEFGSPSAYDLGVNIIYDDEAPVESEAIEQLSRPAAQSAQSDLDYEMRKKGQQLIEERAERLQAEEEASALSIGEQRTFYVDRRSDDGDPIDEVVAELKKIGEQSLIYVEQGYSLEAETLAELASDFDDNIYPAVTDYFGRSDTSIYDWDGNGKKIILIKDMSNRGQVRGYFRPTDLYDIDGSNYADMIYLNYQVFAEIESGGPYQMDNILATTSHELQHLLFQVEKDKAGRDFDDIWINEGFSGLAEYLTGYNDFKRDYRINDLYFAEPHRESLVQWSRFSPSYGSTRLFALYLKQRLGRGIIEEVMQSSTDALQVIEDAYSGGGFTDFYLSWLLTNYISNSEPNSDYSYPLEFSTQPAIEVVEKPTNFEAKINSSAVQYFKLRGQEEELKMEINTWLADIGVITYRRNKD